MFNSNTFALVCNAIMITDKLLRCITLLFLWLTLATLSCAKPLVAFRSCADLQRYFRKNALSRVGPYGIGDYSPRPIFLALSAPEVAADSAPTEGVDFSGTNVQVEGVDEPDIVKTDGTRIFALRGNKFFVVKVRPDGKSGVVVGNLTLPLYARDMLFYKDSVLVIANRFGGFSPIDRAAVSRSFLPSFGPSTTVLYRILLSGRAPKIVGTLEIEGNYISGRSVGGVTRIIMSFNPLSGLPLRYPDRNITSKEATQLNKNVIWKLSEKDWLPSYSLSSTRCFGNKCIGYAFKDRPLLSCNAVYYPKDEFSGFNTLSVLTIQMEGPIEPTAVGIIADGQTIYATTKSLYAATTEYEFDARRSPAQERLSGPQFTTSFHKFDLFPSSVKYAGSGSVSGSVLNQFSMHEYSGTFFIATTDGAPWWGSRDTSSSKISAFKASSSRGPATLHKIGEVGNLGQGERIYAVRYIGSVGYVVTFRQVDPLYIVDLSNARKLRVTGELKIPGYSAYLHVVGEGRLLGVGREVTLEGRTTGAKVSLFDVSDVTSPKELSTWTLKGSYSNAEWDHRAFLYWPPEKVAVLPVSVYSDVKSDRFTGSIVLSISDKSIDEKGRITHRCCGNEWELGIERNFILGRTNLWSLSSRALQANDVKTLKFESNIRLS